MKIDIYHLYRHFDYACAGYPIVVDVLKLWAMELGWEVRVAVCKEHEVDLESDADVVAFSVYTQTSPGAYRLGSQLRKKGKVVVFGGPHFRNSDGREGSPYCDVIVHSICREQFQELLDSVERGELVPATGKTLRIEDTERRFRYPDNLSETMERLSFWQLAAVPTSLGCPYDCSFCNPFMQGEYLLRDVNTVAGEVAKVERWRPVFLADATTGLNKRYTIELMHAIAPLGRSLLIESTLSRLQDTEVLDAFAAGGVKWITVGVESFNTRLGKLGARSVHDSMERLLDNAHERGIMIEGNFICGLDNDGPESFESISEFYRRSSLDLIIIDILTPYPNTRLYDELRQAGRIIDHNYEHYDYRHVVYRPKLMTEEQLADGFVELYRNLYSGTMITKKMAAAFMRGGLSLQTLGTAVYNGYGFFDSLRKERALDRNKEHVAFLLKNLQTEGA